MSGYLRNILWQAGGNGFAQIIGLAAMPIITRLYSPEDFSLLNLLLQFAMAFSIMVSWRVEYFIFSPKGEKDAEKLLRWLLQVSFILMLLLTLVVCIFSKELGVLAGNARLSNWIFLAPITAWFISASTGLQQLAQRRGDFKKTGGAEVLNKSGYVASAIFGGWFTWSVVGLVASNTVGLMVKTVFLARESRIRLNQFSWCEGSRIAKKLLRMSTSMSISNGLGVISGILPFLYISKAYGANVLGAYGLVVSTLYLPSSLLGVAIGQAYYQKASGYKSNGEVISPILKKTVFKVMGLGVPLYAFVAATSSYIYPFIFGSKWVLSGEMASVMALSAGAAFISTSVDKTSLVVGAWRYLLLLHILRAMIVIGLTFFAQKAQLSVIQYLVCLAVGLAFVYVIDLLASMYLAGKWDVQSKKIER